VELESSWSQFARQTWGSAVALPEGDHAKPWLRYCLKRLSLVVARPSPLNLLQESYLDPWRHIACCMLMRCAGWDVLRQQCDQPSSHSALNSQTALE